jgi:hypothetical protein
MAEYQRNLFTRRWRTVPELEPSEFQLQVALIEHCRWRAYENVEFFAVPNGEVRDKRVAAKLKAQGVLPGVSDLIFEWGPPPQVLHLELKAKGRKPTKAQQQFGERALARGHMWECVDNLDDALALLGHLGILKPELARR